MKKLWFNILLGLLLLVTVVLAVVAVVTAPHEAGVLEDSAISANLYWGYALLVAGVVVALFCALFGLLQKPASLVYVGGALLLIAVVVGVAYFISAGHELMIPNLADGGFFPHKETVITETCVYVTYVAGAAALLTALCTEIWRAFK